MMKYNLRLRIELLALAAAGAALASGCLPLTSQGYPIGAVYSDTKAPSSLDRAETTGENKSGPKTGRACSAGVLGIAAWGDASIDAAKKQGGITSVHSVEYEATAVLGIVYVNVCTVVHGA
jgi:hypothetical protein